MSQDSGAWGCGVEEGLAELQAKVTDKQQKVKLADIQTERLDRTIKHAHFTDTEIMTLIHETNMYKGVRKNACFSVQRCCDVTTDNWC